MTAYRTLTAAIILLPALGLNLRAVELPPPVIPAGVGVNIHFTRGHEQDLDLIAAAGFRFVRMDFGWESIERQQGQYDWSAYDELTANLEKRGLRALYILDYSNRLYEKTVTLKDRRSGKEFQAIGAPQHPESVAAFARWAAAAVRHYHGRQIIWEVWNEPNISFWKPEPDVRQYITLLTATGKAIREADPDATLIAPASSGFPWPFFEELFKAGALEYLDAVSVHPYRDYRKGPETADEDYQKLRELIARFAPAEKKSLPIISGEWGYSTHAKGVSLDTQAAYLVRQQLSNLWKGIPLSIWYDWKNDGEDPNENEHNFGTVYPDLRPKPSYLAIQTMTRQLDGYRIVRRIPTPSENDYVFLCESETGSRKFAAWTADEPHDLELDLGAKSSGEVTAVGIYGDRAPVRLERGKTHLHLSAGPQYVGYRMETGKRRLSSTP
ncbi:MAG: cellulase family glycosylhydrolase [Thermoguttaceae bacterium]|jgi:hypothetical protein